MTRHNITSANIFCIIVAASIRNGLLQAFATRSAILFSYCTFLHRIFTTLYIMIIYWKYKYKQRICNTCWHGWMMGSSSWCFAMWKVFTCAASTSIKRVPHTSGDLTWNLFLGFSMKQSTGTSDIASAMILARMLKYVFFFVTTKLFNLIHCILERIKTWFFVAVLLPDIKLSH